VPDYGYSSWLFHPVSPTIFLSLVLSRKHLLQCYVPAVRSTLPKNYLPERSSFNSHHLIHLFFQTSDWWKVILIQRSFYFQCDVWETKVSFHLLLLHEPTRIERITINFFCWRITTFLLWFKLQLFLNANPEIRAIRIPVQLSIFILLHSLKATFYRSSDDLKIIHFSSASKPYGRKWINCLYYKVINKC